MSSPASPTVSTSTRRAELVALADMTSTIDPATAERAASELHALALSDGDDEQAIEADVWRCIHLLRQGKLRDAISASQAVREQLDDALPGTRLGAARMELLRTIALAGSEAGEFVVAFGAAQELAGDPAIHADAAGALDGAFSLAVCLERMGDNWQALRILTDAIDRHGDAAPSFQMLYALNGIVAIAVGAFHLVHDIADPADSAALLDTARCHAERALELLEEFDTPLYEVAVRGNLGEVLAYQGELEAADELLHTALRLAEHIGAAAYRDRVRASIGEWLLLSDRYEDASAWLDQLLSEMGEDGPHSTLIRTHHAAYLAARALGRFDAALTHHEAYERLHRQRTTNQLQSQSKMFVTRTEAQAEVELHRFSAERDPLTALGNRRQLERLLPQLLQAAADEHRSFTVALVDIDHFKEINDDFGHAVGDAVLIDLAEVFLRYADDDDLVIRYGGDEIVIVMPDTRGDAAFDRCERIRRHVVQHEWSGVPSDRPITISIGVASAPPHDADGLLREADRTLYRAKRAGRNLVRMATRRSTDGRAGTTRQV